MYDSTIPENWSDKKVLVMGLGRFGGGVGACLFLAERGARITVTDLAGENELAESVEQLRGLPITLHLGGHRDSDFTNSDLIIVNPAVRRNSPWLKLAIENNVPLTSEMNLFFKYCPAPIVGITGSNGKSTTTAMIAEVLKTAGRVWVGGNIGQGSLLAKVDRIQRDDIVVLELSSFQLYDLAQLERSPHVAVVTNIAPNHLDWHGTMDEYVRAKKNVFRFQTRDDYLVLNREDEELIKWGKISKSEVIWFPSKDMKRIELKMPGRHNRMNASAALAVSEIFDVKQETARDVLRDFSGLPHRLEMVREFEGVRYYNDSISTTPESTIAAIEAFEENKVLILGGYDKKISFDQLVQKVVGSVKAVVLLGQVRDTLAELIEREKQSRNENLPICEKADDFDHAIALARKLAQPGMVVLLSPACASYDMFRNFQQRGERFRQLVSKNCL
jgi:UDP-N-acetylmuramoylalanine--D-glutamate ligase